MIPDRESFCYKAATLGSGQRCHTIYKSGRPVRGRLNGTIVQNMKYIVPKRK